MSAGVRDADGVPVVAMPIGALLAARAPLLVDGRSQIPSIADRDAAKLEASRAKLAAALDVLGRDDLLAAWPFTTMSVTAPLRALRETAARLDVPADPASVTTQSPGQALLDFLFGIGSLLNVDRVVHGTISSPVFLDPVTRAWRGDGGHVLEDVRFTMTVPSDPAPGPMPVVIFGHGLVTERRFVLAVGSALAAKGYATISIDFPYHGERTYCARGGPVSVVNPFNGSLASLNPCRAGTTCSDEGRCVDAQGQGNALATWGVIDMPVASGAVFLEIDHISNSKDHFQQALIDLGALDQSLRTGAWAPLLDHPVDTSRIFYAGQSLGGIMGAVFLGTDPDIERAVLNVPGADLIPMFDDSTFFSAHLDALFTRQGIERDSYDGRRFLTVAHWFMDAVDPQHLGPITGARALLIQMATLDFIIPNAATKLLQQVTGAPRRDYLGEHGFITIPGGVAWPATWPGATEAVASELRVLRAAPFVARRLGPLRLAVGVHLDAARLQVARDLDFIDAEGDVRLDLDGTGVGLDASAYYTPRANLALALTYRGRTRLDLGGNANFTAPDAFAGKAPDQTARTTMTMPDVVVLGARYRRGAVTALVDVEHTRRSVNRATTITFANASTDDAVQRNDWGNTTGVRAGAEWVRRRVVVRGGGYVDPSPVPTAWLSPTSPDGHRLGLTAGASYAVSPAWSADAFAEHLWILRRETQSPDTMAASYGGRAVVLGVGLRFTR